MLDSLGLSIVQNPDQTYSGAWGPFTVKSGFQPIFRMKDGKATLGAFEALARPFRNGVPTSPGKFFPLVPREESLEVESLTRSIHMLNAGIVLDDTEWLFVNFDPSMFADPKDAADAMRMIRSILKHTGMKREQIVCEVTEHKLDKDRLANLVRMMREEGYKVAVDDYGAEDSDMERIQFLQPDIVKFDAALITRFMNTAAGTDLLIDMVETFRAWGILTLFEGLEEGWQLDIAVKCKVDFVQGFVLAKPVTVPADFEIFRQGKGGRRKPDRAPDNLPKSTYQLLRKGSEPAPRIDVYRESLQQSAPSMAPLETDIISSSSSASSSTPQLQKVPDVPSFGRQKTATFGRRGS